MNVSFNYSGEAGNISVNVIDADTGDTVGKASGLKDVKAVERFAKSAAAEFKAANAVTPSSQQTVVVSGGGSFHL
jgi:hypothetical protein